LPSFIRQSEPEDIAKTLFIISCSARKNPKHEKEKRWVSTINLQKYSEFQEYTTLRKKLLNFYSTINSEKLAESIYQGFKHQNPSRWRKAWKINKGLAYSHITRAIYRYTGKLYSQLNPEIRGCLANNTLSNVLIISALHGPTLPSDYLPFYDLSMGDLWRDEVKLKNKWPNWITGYAGDGIKKFLGKFEEIFVMVGNDYKPSALRIKEIASNVKRYKVAPSFGRKSGEIWGQALNQYLSKLV
jgi:cytoplasmic iron level regulating protein YaaA (DUF328/UPF0246 family)